MDFQATFRQKPYNVIVIVRGRVGCFNSFLNSQQHISLIVKMINFLRFRVRRQFTEAILRPPQTTSGSPEKQLTHVKLV